MAKLAPLEIWSVVGGGTRGCQPPVHWGEWGVLPPPTHGLRSQTLASRVSVFPLFCVRGDEFSQLVTRVMATFRELNSASFRIYG